MGFGINTVTVSGNLTRDPELRSTGGGTAVCGFGIAWNERRKDQQGNWGDVAHFFDVTVWGGQGEWVAKNLTKGTGVVVSGELRYRKWQDQQGNNRSAVDINARNIFVPKGTGGGGGFNDRSDVPVGEDFNTGSGFGGGFGGGSSSVDDEIPFVFREQMWEARDVSHNPFD
jgi:single-strand DNA-binding protein